MQLSPGTHIPDGLLAANVLLSEKPRLGVPSWKSALHQGISEANCTAAIGLRASESLNRVQSRYTDKERDAESGLDYFGVRYYSSVIGRFSSPDDGEDQDTVTPQSWTLYSYGRNNPLIGRDDDGHTYKVCDASGNNCSNIDDKTFEAEQKQDQKNGESFANSTLSHTDANGSSIKDGRFTHDPDIAGDPRSNIAAMGRIGNQGMGAIKYFAAGSVTGGVTGGVGLSALGGGAGLTTLGTFSYILSNADAGAIIGWGTGQAESGVPATQQLAANLTAEDVAGMEAKGLNPATAQKLLNTYERAVGAGKAGGKAMARRELMIKSCVSWGNEDAPMSWSELLNLRWQDLGLHSAGGTASEGVISAFEDQHSIRLPTDLRIYFLNVNGMSMRGGHDVDDNGFSFLPIAKVRTVGAFSFEMGWTVGDGVGLETAFVFVDYLQWCCACAFETASRNAGAIYLLGYEQPKSVAPSMSEFAAMYLADDPLLYHPK